MRHILTDLLELALVSPALAQGTTPEKEPKGELDSAIDALGETTRLPVTTVTATRTVKEVYDLPKPVTVIERKTVEKQSPLQIVDAMTMSNAGIIMDIRTGTTGDPIMRGWSGFNILTLIDMNSLSTLWGEGGFGADDMYAKIDTETVERIEIIHGPHSVLYGSNALGGVVNFITRSSPIGYQGEGEYSWGGRARYVYTGNSGSHRTRLEAYGAGTNFKYLLGWTYIAAGDLEGGRGQGTLDPTSGTASHYDFRLDWMVCPGHELTFSVLDINWRETHRYYRPTQDNNNDRTGVAVTYKADELLGFMKNFSLRGYYQFKRDEPWFHDTNRKGYAETITYATDANATTFLGTDHALTYGVHAHVDQGESADDEQFTFTDPPPTEADAPDTDWWDLAAYVEDDWAATEWLEVLAAIRYDYFIFESKSTDTYRAGDPLREEDFFTDKTGAWTGGLGVTLKQSWIDAELFGYYSLIHDLTEVRPDTFGGQEWIDFNDNGIRDPNEDVVSHQPTGGAWIYGFEMTGTIYGHEVHEAIPANYTFWGSVAWNYGKTEDDEWFRHTQPLRGIVALRWDDLDPQRKAYVEFRVEMVDRYDRIPRDRVDADLSWQRDPQDGQGEAGLLRSYGGVPGYTIYSLYGGMNLCPNARLNLAVENLTNKKFRRAHSRMDAPGINFTAGIDIRF